MKRGYRNGIFIGLVLCILIFTWILIGDKSWMSGLWHFLNSAWEYVSNDKMLSLTFAIVILTAALFIVQIWQLFLTKRQKPAEIIPPERSLITLFPVKNTKQLGEVANTLPFMENPVVGKFMKGKTWNDVKKEVDFSLLQPLDLSTIDRIFIIKGKLGIGKSTYMLWRLDELLRSKSFRNIIFLNPETYEHWAQDLSKYETEKTLLVIDALRRGGDNDEDFKRRSLHLFRLSIGEESIGGKILGPFKVLITIRDDEYNYLVRQREFEPIFESVFTYEITPQKLDFEVILKKYLNSYGIRYKVPVNKEKAVIKLLVSKSEGIPFYIRHLIVDLRTTNRSFSENVLNEYPTGMVNLIWQAIKKGYYIENDNTIPFLLLLLLHTDKDFSHYYFDFVVDNLTKKEIKKKVKTRIKNLKTLFIQSSLGTAVLEDTKAFTLDSHWKTSLKKGLAKPEIIDDIFKDLVDFYRQIDDMEFQRLKEEVGICFKNHLQNGFKDKADVFLCVDLAKMGEEYLESATEIYCSLGSLSRLAEDYINYVRDELYMLWISTAWKYRAVYNDKKVISCYENAFDKLGVKVHLKQLSAFAYYLQARVLQRYKYGTQEFQGWKAKIESLHKEVIERQLEQGIKDPISYQTLALFYKSIGEYQKAEENFEKSLQIDPFHYPTLQAYAIFHKDRGNIEWYSSNQVEASKYYRKAEEQFKKGRDRLLILRAEKGKLSKKEQQYEKEILNAYAIFLIDQAKQQVTQDEKRKYDEFANELFEEVLEKYSDHTESINKYADFLMKYGWILPKYKNGKNLEEAEKLLNDYIIKSKAKGESPNVVTLHILAILLYKFKAPFEKWPPDFQKAVELLRESARSLDPKHNSIAYHELAHLYLKWASYVKSNQDEYNNKMESASKYLQKALELPENPAIFIHLSKVYLTYAFYFTYNGQIEQARIVRDKAFELAEQAQIVPQQYYTFSNIMGDELIEEEPEEAMEFYIKAKEMGEELSINNSYSYFKLGECHKRLATQETTGSIEFINHVEDALDNYLQSARNENTSEGYGTRRDSIKQLMADNEIKGKKQPDLYQKCIRTRVECSRNAFQLYPNHWKNCGDYGEDLFLMKEYVSAIPVLEKGVNLLLSSTELNEAERKKRLSWFYEKIGFCFKDSGNLTKAGEFLSKSARIEDSAVSYFRFVNWMFNLKKYEKTLLGFQKLINKLPFSEEEKESIFPYMSDILKKIAMSYEKLQKVDEALIFWEYYADISFCFKPQESAREYGFVGNKLLKKHFFHKARECFVNSVRLEPNSAQNLSQLGYVNYELQRWEECMICSSRAFSISKDPREETQYMLCQQKHESNLKVYDSSKIEDLLDMAIIEELRSENNKAIQHYSDALAILDKQQFRDGADILKYKFIGDAFWVLGEKNNALESYKKVKEIAIGCEKMIAEVIYYLLKKELNSHVELSTILQKLKD